MSERYMSPAGVARDLGVTMTLLWAWRTRYASTAAPFPLPDKTRPKTLWKASRWPEIKKWHDDFRSGALRNAHRYRFVTRTPGGYLSSREVAAALGVSRSWLVKVRAGHIPVPVPFPAPDVPDAGGHNNPVPLWRASREDELHAWNADRLEAEVASEFLAIPALAKALGVATQTLRTRREESLGSDTPCPAPDKEVAHSGGVSPKWRVERVPEIEAWHLAWVAAHVTGRRRQGSTAQFLREVKAQHVGTRSGRVTKTARGMPWRRGPG